MQKAIFLAILFGVVLYVNPTFAQVYTLEQCKEMSLVNNAKTKNSALDIEAARQKKREVFTKYFPSIEASGLVFKADDELIKMGVTIPGMGTLPIQLIDEGLIATITAIQPVFAGGKVVNGSKLAQIAIEVAELRNNLSKEEVLKKSEKSYWQIVAIKEHLNTMNSIDTLLNRIYLDVDKAVEVGVASNNDLLKIRLQQNEVESGRLTLDNLLILAKMQLAQHIGVSMDSLERVDVVYVERDREPIHTYNISAEEAIDRLSSYKLLCKGVEAARVTTRLQRGEYLPTVGIGYSYVNENLICKSTNHGVVFASVSVPLSGWWEGSHAIKRGRIEEQKAQNERDDISEQLQLRMQQTWSSLVEAEKQITLAELAIKQSNENMKMNINYYNAGTSPVSDLLDAQVIYRQSNNRLTNAKIDYKLKLSEYLFATGRGLNI